MKTGNAWRWRRQDDSSKAIVAPENAFIRGNKWLCRTGYRKVDGACVAVRAPLNATIRGNAWRCNPGFTQPADGTSCQLVN